MWNVSNNLFFKIRMMSPEMDEVLSHQESAGPFVRSLFIGKENKEPEVAADVVSESVSD